jgi:pimeloyl-ACP methyl ester carboxylesterase
MPQVYLRHSSVILKMSRLRYIAIGRSKPNIILVHGYPDSGSVWDLLANYLVDEFHLIRYDIRGV